MRGLGNFQIAQMKGDPRTHQLFRTLRQALDLLEEIVIHPQQEPSPPKTVTPPASPPARQIEVPPERLAYSIRDVCKLTGLSRGTIYADIQKGLLRSSKCGSRTLILAKDLQAWMGSWAER